MSIFKRVSELTPYEFSGATAPLDCFADAISKAIRGVKFGVVDGKSHREVHVYTEGQPFTMGYIGYGDWRDSGYETIYHYNVVSPNITNEKYSYGDACFRKMSTKLDVALKTAKRYFRNLTPEQMAQNEISGIRSSYNDIRYDLRRDKDEKHDKLLRGDAVLSEFRHMLQQGYEFVDQRFGEEVQAYITSIDEHAEAKAKGLNVAFVRVFEKFGEQAFQVVRMHGLHKMSRPPKDNVETYSSDTLPVDLMSKLTTLNMVAHKDYVEGVGFNSGDGMFYVQL